MNFTSFLLMCYPLTRNYIIIRVYIVHSQNSYPIVKISNMYMFLMLQIWKVNNLELSLGLPNRGE